MAKKKNKNDYRNMGAGMGAGMSKMGMGKIGMVDVTASKEPVQLMKYLATTERSSIVNPSGNGIAVTGDNNEGLGNEDLGESQAEEDDEDARVGPPDDMSENSIVGVNSDLPQLYVVTSEAQAISLSPQAGS